MPREYLLTALTLLPDKVSLVSSTGWYKANTDYFGYYRVNYDTENWNALRELLKSNREILSEMDRAELLDDAMNLARWVPISCIYITLYI